MTNPIHYNQQRWFIIDIVLAILLSVFLNQTALADNASSSSGCPQYVVQPQKTHHPEWYIRVTASTGIAKKIGIYSQYPYHANACFTLQNLTLETVHYSVYIENPRMHHAELLTQEGSSIVSSVIGLDYPLQLWGTDNTDTFFDIDLAPESQSTYNVLIGSKSIYNTKIRIMEQTESMQLQSMQKTLAGFLAGIVIILSIYFLFLASSTRDTTYFYLSISTLSVMLMQLSDLGLLYRFWPMAIQWNSDCSFVFAVLSAIFGSCLARRYLDTSTTMPYTDRLLKAFFWYFLVVALPLSLSPWNNMMMAFFGMPALALMIVLLVISISRIRMRFEPAKLYLLAYFLPLLAGILIILTYSGVIPSSPMTRLVPLISTAIQLVLFAMALGERINWLQAERDIAHYAAIQASTEMQTKRHFLAQISHDLRTPLIGIIGLTELIDRKSFTRDDIKLITGMESSAKHLLQLTNDLLDHARLDAGKWTPNITLFSIRQLLLKQIENEKPAATAKHLTVSAHIHENIPDQVFGDEKLLQRILHEIFDNAIKFTTTGSIALMAEALPHHSNKRFTTVRFDIIDTGIGFDTDFQERIFKMFELADDSSTRHQGGAGIGLSLCKKFCHLLDGDIQCESQLGKGTVFCITLPFSLPVSTMSNTAINSTAINNTTTNDKVLTQATPAASIHEPINFLRDGYSILIAEDDEAIQMIVCALLDKMGSNSHQAFNNGKLLLDHYCVHHATTSLLLLDWNMPIMNARQTVQAVRAFEAKHQLAAVPIALMSAHDAHSELHIEGEPELPILFKPISVNSLKKLLNIV